MPPSMPAPHVAPAQPRNSFGSQSESVDEVALNAALDQLSSTLQASLMSSWQEQELCFARQSKAIKGIIIEWQAKNKASLGIITEWPAKHNVLTGGQITPEDGTPRIDLEDSFIQSEPQGEDSFIKRRIASQEKVSFTLKSPTVIDVIDNGSEASPNSPKTFSKDVCSNDGEKSQTGSAAMTKVYPVALFRSLSSAVQYKGATAVFDVEDKSVKRIFQLLDNGRFSQLGLVVGHSWAQPLSKEDSCIARHTQAWYFTLFVALIIVSNSIIIGIQINYEAGRLLDKITGRPVDSWGFKLGKVGNGIFAGCFTFELCLRFYAERIRFLVGPTWKWNWFDLVLVISANLELAFSGLSNLSFARALRILRMVRVLQVLRLLRVFDVLRQMVFAILNSFMSMVWIVVLIWLWMYVFGIYFLSTVASHVEALIEGGTTTAGPEEKILDELFGTLPMSMLSLFQAVTGGKNWGEVMDPLSNISDLNVVVFVAFYIFIVLGVMNIVTGIFVEKATEIAELDRELRVMQRMDENDMFTKDMRAFFAEVDADSSGTLDWEEFQSHLKEPRVQAYFENMGLDAGNARHLFDLLDAKGDGYVSIEDFLKGCTRMKGTAKSMDLVFVQMETKKVSKMLEVLMSYVEDQLIHMEDLTRTTSRLTDKSVNALSLQAVPSISERILNLRRQESERSFHRLSHVIDWPAKSTNTAGSYPSRVTNSSGGQLSPRQ